MNGAGKREMQEAPVDEVAQIKAFVEQHGRLLSWCVIGVLLVILAVTAYQRHTRRKTGRALEILTTGTTRADYETVLNQYASTPAAPWALLRLAKTYFDSGNYVVAEEKYGQFQNEYPDHEMAAAAELGKVHCLEAGGRFREALEGFSAFAGRHPDHFMTPQAVLGQGRCLEQIGRLREAKALYEDFLAKHPDSGWVPRVEEVLENVSGKLEKAEPSTSTDEAEPKSEG